MIARHDLGRGLRWLPAVFAILLVACQSTAPDPASGPAPGSSISIAQAPWGSPPPGVQPSAQPAVQPPPRAAPVPPRPVARTRPAPAPRVDSVVTRQPPPRAPSVPPIVFRFEVGDEVGIAVWREEDLTVTQRVLRDGTVSPPLLDPIPVAGRTIPEVRQALVTGYEEYLQDPRVTVTVASVYSDRVFILGEVNTPSAVPMGGATTLLQGIAQAGGFIEGTSDRSTVRLIRRSGRGPARVLTVDADRILAGQARLMVLRPGDIVYVHPTGLAQWSRTLEQILSPISTLIGDVGSAATSYVAVKSIDELNN